MIPVAILGGAFDPITKGHIQSVQFVLKHLQFDEIWIMPAYKHMYGKKMVDPEHRLEMCRLAAEVDSRIKVFDYEIKNKLSGETYNFVKSLQTDKELNEKYDFSLIIGLDNANTFDKFFNFEELKGIAKFVVIPRKGYKKDPCITWYLKEPHIFLYERITCIINTSSTRVKHVLKKYKQTKDISEWMDEKVYSYIIANKLYGM